MASLTSLPRKHKIFLAFGAVALVTCAYTAIAGSHGWLHLRQLRDDQRALEEIAFKIEQQNARMREHLDRLETDDAYLERVVRERLGWVRPGEIVYRLDAPSPRAESLEPNG